MPVAVARIDLLALAGRAVAAIGRRPGAGVAPDPLRIAAPVFAGERVARRLRRRIRAGGSSRDGGSGDGCHRRRYRKPDATGYSVVFNGLEGTPRHRAGSI